MIRRHQNTVSVEKDCCFGSTIPFHQFAKVTQNTGALKHTLYGNIRKKGFLCSQVNHPLSALYVNRSEEIGGEGRKWLLKRVRALAQAAFCGPGSGTLLPPSWFHQALGMRSVYLPQLAHFTPKQDPVTAQPVNWCWGTWRWKLAVLTLAGFNFFLISPRGRVHTASPFSWVNTPSSLSRGGTGYYRCVLCMLPVQ